MPIARHGTVSKATTDIGVRRMTRFLAGFMLCALFLTAPEAAAAQDPAALALLPRTDVLLLTSNINGARYKIYITKPDGYAAGQSYAALYLLDGDTYSPYLATLQSRLEGDVPPMLFVSIGYQGESERAQDYPTVADSYWKVDPKRGAATFLRVLRDEIIPQVEARYPIDPARRGLGGHSMGGFFTAYALFQAPHLFTRYWISSPPTVWDRDVLFRVEQQALARHEDINANVFADIGGLEEQGVIDAVHRLGSALSAGDYPHLRWTFRLVADLPHSFVPVAVLPYAMLSLYGRDQIKLSEVQIARLAGHYRLPDGSVIELVSEAGGLRLVGCACDSLRFGKVTLLADTPDTLYLRYIGVSLSVVDRAAERPQRLRIDRDFEGHPSPPLIAERIS